MVTPWPWHGLAGVDASPAQPPTLCTEMAVGLPIFCWCWEAGSCQVGFAGSFVRPLGTFCEPQEWAREENRCDREQFPLLHSKCVVLEFSWAWLKWHKEQLWQEPRHVHERARMRKTWATVLSTCCKEPAYSGKSERCRSDLT